MLISFHSHSGTKEGFESSPISKGESMAKRPIQVPHIKLTTKKTKLPRPGFSSSLPLCSEYLSQERTSVGGSTGGIAGGGKG